MKFFEKLDLAILDGVFQPVANWWNDKTPWSHFLLGRILAWGALVSYSAFAVFMEKLSDPVGLFFIGVSMLLIVGTSQKLEEREHSILRFGVNPLRYNRMWKILRQLALMLMVLIAIALVLKGFGYELHKHSLGERLWRLIEPFCWFSSLYLVSCVPKIPDTSRQSQLASAYTKV